MVLNKEQGKKAKLWGKFIFWINANLAVKKTLTKIN